MDKLKIDSEVATDNDKDEFLEILKTGIAKAEMKINIRASDYRFEDKTKYYKGELHDRRQNRKAGTKIVELIKLSDSHTDFVETDIEARNNAIFDGFIAYLRQNNLVKS